MIGQIGILGAGAWGTALAAVARQAGREVTIWAHEAETAAAIAEAHENPLFLPGVTLPEGLRGTTEPADLAAAEAILLAVPAQHLRGVLSRLAPALDAATPLVLCAKGIEEGTGRLLSEIVAEVAPGHPFAVLSGPTFAAEVAAGLPTAVTVASADAALAGALAEALATPNFRPYAGDDPIGAELGGALKNVIAIACGIVEGAELGSNARAALMTRGLAEIVRLGVALGARPETFLGLSGLGDLTLTCNSLQSRNCSLGVALGEGRALADILAERRAVTEGVATAAAAMVLARRHGVEMPVVTAVDGILHSYADIGATIRALLARPLKAER